MFVKLKTTIIVIVAYHIIPVILDGSHKSDETSSSKSDETSSSSEESSQSSSSSLSSIRTTDSYKVSYKESTSSSITFPAEVGDYHLFNMTPITGRGLPTSFMDMEKPKIYGAEKLDIRDGYGFTVAIVRRGQMVGCGAMVSPEWVLTTAYNALYDEKEYPVRIRIGSNSPFLWGYYEEIVEKQIYPFFNYTWDHNIALLRIGNWRDQTREIRVVQIKEYLPPPVTDLTLIGWGTNNKYWQILMEGIILHSTEPFECKEKYKDAADISKNVFCVEDTRRGPCHWNFGAPVVNRKDHRLVGLYLGTHKCNSRNSYGAYIDVTAYKKWIVSFLDDMRPFVPEGIPESKLNEDQEKYAPSTPIVSDIEKYNRSYEGLVEYELSWFNMD